jgi:hypothetical protein
VCSVARGELETHCAWGPCRGPLTPLKDVAYGVVLLRPAANPTPCPGIYDFVVIKIMYLWFVFGRLAKLFFMVVPEMVESRAFGEGGTHFYPRWLPDTARFGVNIIDSDRTFKGLDSECQLNSEWVILALRVEQRSTPNPPFHRYCAVDKYIETQFPSKEVPTAVDTGCGLLTTVDAAASDPSPWPCSRGQERGSN